MKTLIYTSIYSNLWGSEFGGRPSRNQHYKFSLLNILNLNADKFICFTNEEEIDQLKDFFYTQKKISEEKLQFIVFDLKNTKYYEDIKKLKNISEMQKSDRCYEIQYNKFFWIDHLADIESYDRVFWVDAGLSHGGIIPEKYSFGNGYEKNFNFTLFNEQYLKRICDKTRDKILLLSKNNNGHFYWSFTIPEKYYNKYNRGEHIIGGMFGGTPKKMFEFKNKFEELLKKIITNETTLYYEELLMSCLYFNDQDFFTAFKFDDWYDRKDPEKYGNYVKYFYNVLEIPKTCVATLAFEIQQNSKKYLESAKKLIKSNLEYTDFDVLILTNHVDYFKDINDARVEILNYHDHFRENSISGGKFNMHLKRYPIRMAKNMGYDVIFYNDCDCFIDGWDNKSFTLKMENDFDIFFVSHANPQLGGLRKSYEHFQKKIDIELAGIYTEDMDNAPNPAETRVIFKNNQKLNLFLEFWDKISNNNNNYFTYYDGVYFGTSSIYAKMKLGSVTKSDEFSKYCHISHMGGTLNYFGEKTTINKPLENQVKMENNKKFGQFEYSGLYVLQNPDIYNVFLKLLSDKKPSRIVEIGTEYGGLTMMLKDISDYLNIEDFIIRTYDIKPPKFLLNHPNLNHKIEIVTKNIFESDYSKLKENELEDLKSFTKSDSVNIFLCDGGNKIREFNIISSILKEGDIIMAHDYAKDLETFKNKIENNFWNWCEIKESDIEKCSIEQNLQPYMQDDFEKVAWVCKIKK